MAEELKKIFEQLLLILTHSQARKKTCEWRHNNNSRGQVGKIMKKKLPAPWNSKQSQVFNHADF